MMIGAASQGRFGAAFEWLGVERAWTRTRGNPEVIVGIVDEGVQLDHPLLAPNIRNGHAQHASSIGSLEIPGTHAAGVAAGRENDVERFSGVAPGSRLLPVRYSTGLGPQALDLAHAIEYAVEMGAHIVNVSPSGELASSTVQRAIQYAATRNVLVVSTAIDAPRQSPNQINVLSVDEHYQPLAACLRESAHLAAPAFARVPHWRENGHSVFVGAAMGAPYVSGCAALLKSLNPSWGYHELKEHLLASGTPRAELVGKCHTGNLLNIANAVLGPLELVLDTKSLRWSSLNDAVLEWRLRYRAALCAHAVALYRPHGDEHWRELGSTRAAALKMTIPAGELRRSTGTLRLACRESNFHSGEVELTID